MQLADTSWVVYWSGALAWLLESYTATVYWLQPLKFAVSELCRYDTNLISAQSALPFCIVQQQKQSSELSKTLAGGLVSRIGLQERYGTQCAILQYLNSPSAGATAAVTDVFTIPSNDVIRKFIRRLVTRLEEHAVRDCR